MKRKWIGGNSCLQGRQQINWTWRSLQELQEAYRPNVHHDLKVASDGYTKIGEPVELISNIPSDGANIEAPALIYDPTHKLYILFFNSHCYILLKYQILYATSKTLLGPYKRADKPFLASGDTKAVVRAPGGIDFNANAKNYTRFVFRADLNLEWFHNKGKRDRGMFAASMEVDDDSVATVKELF